MVGGLARYETEDGGARHDSQVFEYCIRSAERIETNTDRGDMKFKLWMVKRLARLPFMAW